MIFVYLFILFFIFQIYIIKNRNTENFFNIEKCSSEHVPPNVIYGNNIEECINTCNTHIKKINSNCGYTDTRITNFLGTLSNSVYDNMSNTLTGLTLGDSTTPYIDIFTKDESVYPIVNNDSKKNVSTRCLSECLSCKSPTRCQWKHIFKDGGKSRISGGLMPSENQFNDVSLDTKEIKLEYSSENNMLYWTINKRLIDDYNGGCVNNNMYNISFKIIVGIKKLLASVTAASTAANSDNGIQKERIYRLCDIVRTDDENNVNNYKFQVQPDFFEDKDACYNVIVQYNNDNFMTINSKSLEICKKKEDTKLPGILSSTDILSNLLNKTLEISL